MQKYRMILLRSTMRECMAQQVTSENLVWIYFIARHILCLHLEFVLYLHRIMSYQVLCWVVYTTMINGCQWVLGLIVRFLKHSAQQQNKLQERKQEQLLWFTFQMISILLKIDFLCLKEFEKCLDFCRNIGIQLAAVKTVIPTQIIEFVDIEIDVRLRQTRLPRDNIEND